MQNVEPRTKIKTSESLSLNFRKRSVFWTCVEPGCHKSFGSIYKTVAQAYDDMVAHYESHRQQAQS